MVKMDILDLKTFTFSRRFCPKRRTRERTVKLRAIKKHGVTINTTLHEVLRRLLVQFPVKASFTKTLLSSLFFPLFFPSSTLLSFFYSSFQNGKEYTFSPGFAILGGIRIAACSYICIYFHTSNLY